MSNREARQLAVAATDRLLRDQLNRELADAAEAGVWPAALWSALCDAGLTLAAVPESDGGAGMDGADAYALLRVIGAHAAPVPLAEQMVASHILAEVGGKPRSDEVLTVALPDGDQPLAIDHDRISGSLPRVPWGRQAHRVLVPVSAGLALLSPEAGACSPGENLAGEPRDELTFDNAPGELIATNIGMERLRNELALTRVQLMAGALEAILDQSVNYAMEREQFGRPIARFQAVQHQLAELAGEVAAASQAAEVALAALPTVAFPVQLAAAKVRAGEAVGRSTEIAHQVHGAMGFTHEHHLHRYTRRLWSWRDEWGDEFFWQLRLGEAVIAAGADRAWAFIASR